MGILIVNYNRTQRITPGQIQNTKKKNTASRKKEKRNSGFFPWPVFFDKEMQLFLFFSASRPRVLHTPSSSCVMGGVGLTGAFQKNEKPKNELPEMIEGQKCFPFTLDDTPGSFFFFLSRLLVFAVVIAVLAFDGFNCGRDEVDYLPSFNWRLLKYVL